MVDGLAALAVAPLPRGPPRVDTVLCQCLTATTCFGESRRLIDCNSVTLCPLAPLTVVTTSGAPSPIFVAAGWWKRSGLCFRATTAGNLLSLYPPPQEISFCSG